MRTFIKILKSICAIMLCVGAWGETMFVMFEPDDFSNPLHGICFALFLIGCFICFMILGLKACKAIQDDLDHCDGLISG